MVNLFYTQLHILLGFLLLIDFLQILELADKYKGTMESLGKTIGDLSANTLLDKLRFFESTVFNYINKAYFDRLGAVLKLNDRQINAVYKRLKIWLPEAIKLIDSTFLDSDKQKAYKELIAERVKLFTTDSAD